MKSPILGSAYTARSVNAADNRMINLFPEVVAEGGQEPAFLNRAPGLRLITSVGTGPVRGLWTFDDNMYVVSGNSLYKLDLEYNITTLGVVANDGPVSMTDDGIHLFVACNGPSFVYNADTNVFGEITDVDFPGALTVSYLGGYFVFIEPNSQRVWTSTLLDPLTIDPLDFASAEGDPDHLVSSITDHSEVWLFGGNSVEVWYNAAAAGAGFPLQRIQGAFNEIGCAATFSVAKLDNGLFWLGADDRGRGIVYRSQGYTGVRISTHAVEWQIQQYGDISDAIAYTYQQDGHAFYVLTFPTAQATWVFDVASQAWHERASFTNGEFSRHRSNCQVSFNQEIIVGDYQNGNLYAFDLNVYADGPRTQKWLRSWRALPTGTNNFKRTAQHSLQLDCETGVGLPGVTEVPGRIYLSPLTISGSLGIVDQIEIINAVDNFVQPQVMLRWSDDGGHTWSNEHWKSMGGVGEYFKRVIWRRLGMTLKLRDRVYEISGTDPVKIAIMAAELDVTATKA
jgi:hypothetical protein